MARLEAGVLRQFMMRAGAVGAHFKQKGVSIVGSALKGRAQCAGRLVRPFRAERGFGVGFPRVLPWAGFGEGRWPLDRDHTPSGDGSWEMFRHR